MTSACNVAACAKTSCAVTKISTEVGKVGVGRVKEIRVLKQLKVWPHASIFKWIGLILYGAQRVRTNTIVGRSGAYC